MLLFELEERVADGAVAEFHDQLATRAFPRLLGLSNVFVLIGRRVIAQTASACRHRFFNRIGLVATVAGNGL